MGALPTGGAIAQGASDSLHDRGSSPYCPVEQNGVMVCGERKSEPNRVPKVTKSEVQWEDFISAKLFTGAYEELRCEGFGDRQARRIYQRRFAERERRITVELTTRYGPADMDRVLVLHKCPYYRGAGARYDAALDRMERNLGLSKWARKVLAGMSAKGRCR